MICSHCNVSKKENEFMKNRKKCRDCMNADRRRIRKEKLDVIKKQEPNENEKEQFCKNCNLTKKIDEFRFGVTKCRNCENEYKRELRQKNKDKLNPNKKKEPVIDGEKVCKYCNISKKEECFRKNRRRCKDCEKAYGRQYNRENGDKRQKWVDDNKEQMAKLQADWYQRNKEKINQQNRERLKNDQRYILYKKHKDKINYLIKKQDPTTYFLGTKFGIIMKWFEYCFDDKMTWDNYGTYWHCDHVIAVNNFDLTDPEHVHLCFNWKNLSPLSGKENMEKKDKILDDQIKTHCDKLKKFIKKNKIKTDMKEYMDKYNKYLDTLIAKHLDAGIPLEL